MPAVELTDDQVREQCVKLALGNKISIVICPKGDVTGPREVLAEVKKVNTYDQANKATVQVLFAADAREAGKGAEPPLRNIPFSAADNLGIISITLQGAVRANLLDPLPADVRHPDTYASFLTSTKDVFKDCWGMYVENALKTDVINRGSTFEGRDKEDFDNETYEVMQRMEECRDRKTVSDNALRFFQRRLTEVGRIWVRAGGKSIAKKKNRPIVEYVRDFERLEEERLKGVKGDFTFSVASVLDTK